MSDDKPWRAWEEWYAVAPDCERGICVRHDEQRALLDALCARVWREARVEADRPMFRQLDAKNEVIVDTTERAEAAEQRADRLQAERDRLAAALQHADEKYVLISHWAERLAHLASVECQELRRAALGGTDEN